MSVYALEAVIEHSRQRGNRLAVMVAIAYFANEDGEAFPSIDTIATTARVPRRTTIEILKALANAPPDVRELDRVEHGLGKGRGHSNRYRIRLPIRKKGEVFVRGKKGAAMAAPISAPEIGASPERNGAAAPRRKVQLPALLVQPPGQNEREPSLSETSEGEPASVTVPDADHPDASRNGHAPPANGGGDNPQDVDRKATGTSFEAAFTERREAAARGLIERGVLTPHDIAAYDARRVR